MSSFRRFVKNYAAIANPLMSLQKKDAVFEWTENCKKAFELLNEKLMKPPILSRFEENRKTELHTDANYAGLGAMLLQLEDGKHTMVCAISRKLNDAERNYHSTKLEQIALGNKKKIFSWNKNVENQFGVNRVW